MPQPTFLQEPTPIDMRNLPVSLLLFFIVHPAWSQVGINTTSFSDAVVLFMEAQKIPTSNYGGFFMPVVTEAQQASIPVSTTTQADDGLMVYVSDPITGKQCWEIYDGVLHTWRSVYCTNLECSSEILFEEDFSTYLDGTGVTGASSANGNYPSGVSKWSLTSFQSFGSSTQALPGMLVDANDYALVIGGELNFRDTNGAFLFQTQAIDISGYADVLVSLDIHESGPLEYIPASHVNDFDCGETVSDYVDIEYSTDGGITYTEVANYLGNGTTNHTLASDLSGTISLSFSGISGTSFILRVRLQNWADDEIYFLDNIVVRCN